MWYKFTKHCLSPLIILLISLFLHDITILNSYFMYTISHLSFFFCLLQVTNPAIDPLREGLVMSLEVNIGKRGNILEVGPENASQVCLVSFFLLLNPFFLVTVYIMFLLKRKLSVVLYMRLSIVYLIGLGYPV